MKRYSNTKKFLLWFFVVLLLLFLLVVVWRGLKRGADMRPGPTRHEKREQRDRPANDSPPAEPDVSLEVPLDELTEQAHFGWPASPVQVLELVEFSAFALAYSEQHEQAAWVAYRLYAREGGNRHPRNDRFMADNRVTTGSSTPEDYANSGYDRGHLAPAADFSHNKEALKETFYMSNMSPQDPSFNRGIWSKLENQIRDWANDNHELWVVTGPVLQNQKRLRKIGENGVSVPRYFYKVVLDVREPEIKMIGFVLPNKASNKVLTHFVLPVDSIENLTGLDFFPMLPDEVEESLESTSQDWLWFRLN